MTKIHRNGIAPFRFFTPFSHRPPPRISEGQWGENRLKAERAWFLTEEVRRAKPETELLLTRWGKSSVFSDSTVLSFSNILGGRFHRLPSMDNIVAEKRCWGIQGDMSLWSQDELMSPRRGGSEP